MGVVAGLYMCDVVKKVHVRYLISWWVLVQFCETSSSYKRIEIWEKNTIYRIFFNYKFHLRVYCVYWYICLCVCVCVRAAVSAGLSLAVPAFTRLHIRRSADPHLPKADTITSAHWSAHWRTETKQKQNWDFGNYYKQISIHQTAALMAFTMF